MINLYANMRPNGVETLLEDLTYPITTDELLDKVGDSRVELENGSENLSEVFGRVENETYSTPTEANLTFLSALSTKAIGRKAYSDRDPPVLGFGDRDPRIVQELLDEETRHDAGGPHCGICQHAKIVGDWDAMAYCEVKDNIVEPAVGETCADYTQSS
ncbi:MAG: hypothetical protein ACI8VE_002147 [Natrialbaceae archaeon]|jgi:hypothetical protein